ncbi:MAG: hypothetical protein WBI07_12005 [Mobilitalea sp.]
MEVKKTVNILKNNKGSGFALAVAVTLGLVLIFTGITEYFRLMMIAKGVREALQSAVITTVNDNYDDVYHGVREGYSGGYQPIDSEFEESLHYGDIYNILENILGLTDNDEYTSKITRDGKTEFILSDLNVEIKNAPFAEGDQREQRFRIDSSILLEVPVSFAGNILPSMKIRVRTSAGYTPKF